MQAKIITTIGPGGWETYGRRFANSLRYWPKEVAFEIWHHDLGANVPTDVPEGITLHSLDDNEAFQNLKAALAPQAKDGPTYGYAFKAMALSAAVTPELDWIGFLDADTETMQPVDDRLLADLFDSNYHLTYLYRKSVAESEGSFFAFNVANPQGASLLADYWGIYASLEAFHFKKAHDNAVLDRLVTLHKAHGLKVKNLAEGALGLDAFHQSVLGAYLIHYKGPNKDTIASPALGGPGRYDTLCNLLTQSIAHTGQANIVEVGTWNGTRAIQMAEAAFAAGVSAVDYVGFDTFEGGNDRVHEGHTKPHANLQVVYRRLENYQMLMERGGKTFTFKLIKGNTLITMASGKRFTGDATFAYIDGGHSYETTKSDYDNLKHVPYIVFDDVIAKEEEGAPEGPRRVFNEITTGHKQLYISNDGYAGLKQTIGLGVVCKEGVKPITIQSQIVVKPIDSVDKAEQFKHIAENTAAITHWPAACQAHSRVALMVSAGPTLPSFLKEIKKKQQNGAVIFAVKHAFPVLKKAGIRPDFTVILDPRPVDGTSTHGVVRTSLFEDADRADSFLIATMTHPSVRRELEAKKSRLYGWHAHTQGTAEANLPELQKGMVLGGGTCAATRMPMMAYAFGFRRFEFYGYDFFYPEGTDPATVKQQLMKIKLGADNRTYLTTGELVAAMQDLGQWNKWMVDNALTVKFHGEGAGAAIWQQTVNNYKPLDEWPI